MREMRREREREGRGGGGREGGERDDTSGKAESEHSHTAKRR